MRDRTAQQAEGGRIALLATFEQHLHADADAEKGLAARRFEDRVAGAARRELAHAIGQRALSGHHDALGAEDGLGLRGDPYLGLGRDMLERLRHRAKIAHPVIDDRDSHALSGSRAVRRRWSLSYNFV